nr:hypothetical protein [Tanacetum cinerariifolium]
MGGYGEYHNSHLTLPPAWTESGVMLVLPADPGLWSEVISRWESITINRLNNQTWSDNKAKPISIASNDPESEKFSIEEPKHSFSIGYEHFRTPLVTNEVAESSTKNLVPIPRESEVTSDNGKEESDWDDDLVIKERHAQNQQDFLDKYLPQWDDQLATQKQKSELEWENPFAAKRGEDHTILHLSKEEDDNDLPYPKFRKFEQVAAQIIKKHEEHVFPSTSQEESTQSYQPPHDSIMGPSVYPPAQQNPQSFYRPDYQFGYPQGKSKLFSGGY